MKLSALVLFAVSAILAQPDRLKEIVFEGSRRARAIAGETMERVREAVKISYR